RAADPRAAPGPGPRPAITIPSRTLDHVVGVAQGSDAVVFPAHLISGVAADEAIGLGDRAADSCASVPPGYGTAAAIRTYDHVVAVAQGGDGAARLITRASADETICVRNCGA